MVEYRCSVKMISGMHDRPAGRIMNMVLGIEWDESCKRGMRYESKLIRLNPTRNGLPDEADASDILSILNMHIQPGDEIEVHVRGDERISVALERLCHEICNFLEQGPTAFTPTAKSMGNSCI